MACTGTASDGCQPRQKSCLSSCKTPHGNGAARLSARVCRAQDPNFAGHGVARPPPAKARLVPNYSQPCQFFKPAFSPDTASPANSSNQPSRWLKPALRPITASLANSLNQPSRRIKPALRPITASPAVDTTPRFPSRRAPAAIGARSPVPRGAARCRSSSSAGAGCGTCRDSAPRCCA